MDYDDNRSVGGLYPGRHRAGNTETSARAATKTREVSAEHPHCDIFRPGNVNRRVPGGLIASQAGSFAGSQPREAPPLGNRDEVVLAFGSRALTKRLVYRLCLSEVHILRRIPAVQ